ncbi:class I SAM-dependent methyltransferase [Shewanella sp. MBTL60-007]|uniref:class I SAM-dependent methyltransferase n=1 Tax=Shewanella sp. MBTL60-007 TaxID=2815911 RepID=UPI001BC141A6|nr:class I SAM-dependent methyltransferase [Shewanella sp. MBTL60-007]GIU25520.1 ribosomal RNA small subunit methyltransferase C [Shewanella sp. MBTL60-007]
MLTNASQVLLRNSDLVKGQSVLVLNYESDHLPKELLNTASKVCGLALDYHHHLMMQPYTCADLTLYFGHKLPIEECFDSVIVYFPKAKALAPYLFNLAAKHLKPQGQLIVVGENKGGIKSLPKQLPSYFDKPFKADNARHCIVFTSELNAPAPALKLADWISRYQLDTPQGQVTICNLVGVFSEKKLDEGTQLLLANLPKMRGNILDFGCGAGVITAALLKAQPELKFDCVDINAMALASCELTLAANGFKANIFASDGLAQTSQRYDGIISNPPFHDGLASTTNIATNFVKDSAANLKSGGIFHIVANRHLPYSDTIADNFGSVNVAAENNKYKIYSNVK